MVYRFRATMPNNKSFLREYDIKPDMKLYKFHDFLQNDLQFAHDQMVLFEGVDDKGKLRSEYGLFDMGDGSMDTVTFEKCISKGEISLRYVFDLAKNRFILFTLLSEEETLPRESYPRVVMEKGANPDQFYDARHQHDHECGDGCDCGIEASEENIYGGEFDSDGGSVEDN
jgi:hypothetical protein